jgi:HSP20 family protein
MTLYITPSGRLVRRTSWVKPDRTEQSAETDVNILVPINVKSEEDDYVVTALVPGVKADELTIQVHNEVLTISGELKAESKENEKFLLREMPTGRFYRTIRLPEKLDSSKAVADLNDGVLTLRLTKAEEARPKTIKVSVN